jgi:hypothetical protein
VFNHQPIYPTRIHGGDEALEGLHFLKMDGSIINLDFIFGTNIRIQEVVSKTSKLESVIY